MKGGAGDKRGATHISRSLRREFALFRTKLRSYHGCRDEPEPKHLDKVLLGVRLGLQDFLDVSRGPRRVLDRAQIALVIPSVILVRPLHVLQPAPLVAECLAAELLAADLLEQLVPRPPQAGIWTCAQGNDRTEGHSKGDVALGRMEPKHYVSGL